MQEHMIRLNFISTVFFANDGKSTPCVEDVFTCTRHNTSPANSSSSPNDLRKFAENWESPFGWEFERTSCMWDEKV